MYRIGTFLFFKYQRGGRYHSLITFFEIGLQWLCFYSRLWFTMLCHASWNIKTKVPSFLVKDSFINNV